MKTDRKADQAMLEARFETNRGKDREDLKGIMEEMDAKMDTNQAKATKQEEILVEISARMDTNRNEMREGIKSSQAEMRSTVCAIRSELKETIQHGMKVIIQPTHPELYETTACNGATETEPDSGMMQSIERHQEIPKEAAAVMPVGEPRKRRRVCNLAAERRQKRKERTWGYRAPGSGMAKKEPLQECSDPKKWWTAEGIVYRQEADPPCGNDTAQRTRTAETQSKIIVYREF
jgi:hypothetical protein